MFIYYTDYHNVDEDLTAISLHGGDGTSSPWRGTMNRNLADSPTTPFAYVASSNIQNIELYG